MRIAEFGSVATVAVASLYAAESLAKSRHGETPAPVATAVATLVASPAPAAATPPAQAMPFMPAPMAAAAPATAMGDGNRTMLQAEIKQVTDELLINTAAVQQAPPGATRQRLEARGNELRAKLARLQNLLSTAGK